MIKAAAGGVSLHTLTGNPIIFRTKVQETLQQLLIPFMLKQDLNGMPAPYPAGGGPNIWDEDWEPKRIDPATGQNTSSPGIRSAGYIPCEPNTEYFYISENMAEIGNEGLTVCYYDENKDYISGSDIFNQHAYRTPENARYIRICAYYRDGTSVYKNDIAINYPATVTRYSPYKNSCPITGWTGLDGFHVTKNLTRNQAEDGESNGITWTVNADGSITLSGTAEANTYIYLNPNVAAKRYTVAYGECTMVCNAKANYNPQITGLTFQTDVYVDGSYVSTIQNGTPKQTYTGSEIKIGTSRIRVTTGTVIPEGTTIYPQIEFGETPTAYVPCTYESLAVSWENEQGELFGGSLNVLTGRLTSEWTQITVPNSLTVRNSGTPGSTGKYTFFSTTPYMDYAADKVSVYSEVAKAITQQERGKSWEIYASGERAISMFVPADATDESVSAAIGGTKAVVKLKTPVEYQLTPDEVAAFIGENIIASNTNEPIQVQYLG